MAVEIEQPLRAAQEAFGRWKNGPTAAAVNADLLRKYLSDPQLTEAQKGRCGELLAAYEENLRPKLEDFVPGVGCFI